MKANIAAVLLSLTCVGVGIGWYLSYTAAETKRISLEAERKNLSKEIVETTAKLSEQLRVNANLETNLIQRVEDLNTFSNKWTSISATLTKTENEAKNEAEKARVEIEKRDKHITDLEGEKDSLTKKMGELNGQIGSLESLIKEAERKLSNSEGDREVLKKELRRLIAEKTDLEKRFNDLAILRDQVRKLKEELSIAKRLDFIRRGLYGFEKKGAQLLNEGIKLGVPKSSATNTFPLKVEIGSDGSSKITPPPTPSPK
ncbi:MAG: hypothetical protein EXS25_01590 [Pedosphaera sp.]|nr:hypothetical protein [Pedosphaera sp.]